jgi:hypothetical protein
MLSAYFNSAKQLRCNRLSDLPAFELTRFFPKYITYRLKISIELIQKFIQIIVVMASMLRMIGRCLLAGEVP